jgi:hypothetical protein
VARAIDMRRWFVFGLITALVASLIVAVVLTINRETYLIDAFPSQGTFRVEVLDNDSGQGEGYLNENLEIRYILYGKRLLNVGDPDLGLTVGVTNLTRSWGPFIADVKGQTNYRRGYIEENGYWTVSVAENAYIRWYLIVFVLSEGQLWAEKHFLLYLWADTDNNEANGYGTAHKPATTLWDKEDHVKMTVTSYGEYVSMLPETLTIRGTNLIR